MILDENYLNWQKRIQASKRFKIFWALCGIYSVVLIFLLSLYFLYVGGTKIVLLALMAFVLGRLIFSPIIYAFYKKPRPYQKLNFRPVTSWLMSYYSAKPTSFPSDHSISFAAILGSYVYFFPALLVPAVIILLLNGMGRLILGYHYVADILAGWIIGLFSAIIVIYYLAPLVFTK